MGREIAFLGMLCASIFLFEQGWCAKYTLEGALDQIDNRPWPPMGLRYI